MYLKFSKSQNDKLLASSKNGATILNTIYLLIYTKELELTVTDLIIMVLLTMITLIFEVLISIFIKY